MCAGACLLHHVGRVVYAAPSPKFGACGGLLPLLPPGGPGRAGQGLWGDGPGPNHVPEVVGGVGVEESADLLRAFFQHQRTQCTGCGGARSGSGGAAGGMSARLGARDGGPEGS